VLNVLEKEQQQWVDNQYYLNKQRVFKLFYLNGFPQETITFLHFALDQGKITDTFQEIEEYVVR
jgi:hypothetical protein